MNNGKIAGNYIKPDLSDQKIMTVQRPPFRYFGSKFSMGSIIAKYIPNNHQSYVEVFGGSAGVLLNKGLSPIETYNDINDNVINFFQVLRDDTEALVRAIDFTPWSLTEYKNHSLPTDNPVEAARRFWVGQCMSIGNMAYSKSGMRMSTKSVGYKLHCRVEHDLFNIAKRFKQVQIEKLGYKELFFKYDKGSPFTFFYLDPPYLASTRVAKNVYKHEFTEQDHVEMGEVINNSEAYILMSGYDSELYNGLFLDSNGWLKLYYDRQVNGGGFQTEVLYMNGYLRSQLAAEGIIVGDYHQVGMFA